MQLRKNTKPEFLGLSPNQTRLKRLAPDKHSSLYKHSYITGVKSIFTFGKGSNVIKKLSVIYK
jgi:hypothetical protein